MYSRQEIIQIGKLLQCWDEFDKKIRTIDMFDPRTNATYTQVRRCVSDPVLKKWYAKYVGPTGKYTPEDLSKATEFIKLQHRDFINGELAKFNCQINDFPVNTSKN